MALLVNGSQPRIPSVYIYTPNTPTGVLSGLDIQGFPLKYTPGDSFLKVFINGILFQGEYTATDGSSITLSGGRTVGPGDRVVIYAETPSDLINTYTQSQQDARYKRVVAIDGTAVTDLNNLTTAGLHYVNNAANCPFIGFVYVDVITTGGWFRQVAYQFSTGEAATRQFDGSTSTWSAWQSLTDGDGGAELYYISVSSIGVRAVNGGRMRIGGISRPVTGVTISKTGLNPATIYFVYTYWDGVKTAYEVSQTVPVNSSIDGTMCKTGDTSRALVGMCLVMGDTNEFADDPTRRTVLSWHNRKPKAISQSAVGLATAQAGTLATLGAASWFLIWRNQVIDLRMAGYVTCNGTDYVFTAPKLTSPSVTEGQQIGTTCSLSGQFQETGGNLQLATGADGLYAFVCGMRTTGAATATTTSSSTGIIWG